MKDWFSDNAPAVSDSTDWFHSPNATAASMARTKGGAAMGLLPDVMGGLGSLAPGPVGWALSAALGGGGEAARQGFIGQGIDPKKIGIEAGKQAGLSMAGGLATRGLMGVGRGAMTHALKPAAGLVAKFPKVIDTMIKHRLSVGKGLFGTGGLAQAMAKQAAAAAKEKAVLAGTNVTIGEIAGPALTQAEKELGRALTRAEESAVMRAVRAESADLMAPVSKQAGLPVPQRNAMSGRQARKLKQKSQRASRAVYTGGQTGNLVSTEPLSAHVAAGTRQALGKVPGYDEAVGQSEQLIGATRAIRNREANLMPSSFPLGLGIPGVGGLGSQLVNLQLDPAFLSRLALLLTHPATQAGMRQAPRAATAGVEYLEEP